MSFDGNYSDEDHGDSFRSSVSRSPMTDFMDSDDDICTEVEAPDQPKTNKELDEFVYSVLTSDEIIQHQRNIIDEVNSVLQISPQVTRIILNNFKWDKETLFEKYFESTPQEFFEKAHVVNPFATSSKLSLKAVPSVEAPENICGICYCPCEELMGLPCGHAFCALCWQQYLATKTVNEGLAHSITCPESCCDILVDDVSFVKLANDPEVICRYQQLVTNTFVECNTLMRWCPAPNCTNAIKANYAEPRAVLCSCGRQFCFGCGENWHEPASCHLMKLWGKRIVEDSDTSNWISQFTKECPKCNITIEKDGGCNHMICKNPACRYDFCWACLGSWEPHGSSWYNCNRYNEEEGREAREAQERNRLTMSRYLHYYNRYTNHMHSRSMEKKLLVNVQEKMNEMQKSMGWIEVQFLKEAVEILCECRATLMYSYVFAFYLVDNNQKIIFEHNQHDMEMSTEKLSEYLERQITVDDMKKLKSTVLNLYHYCRRRRSVLLSHVREGYENDWWEFNR